MSQPTPLGYPHAGAGTVEILLEKEDGADFAVLFSPDPNNILLREAGLPMQFYYYPKYPRLSKHPDGRFKFSMQVFKGIGDNSGIIGAEGQEEEAGAYTTLTSTIDLPEALLKKAIDKLKTRLNSDFKNHRKSTLFGLFSFLIGVDKDFNSTNVIPIQLTENNIAMHVVGEKSPNNPFGGANPWTFNIQGEGAGTTFGLGDNALSILMGRNSATLVKDSLKSGGNNLVVENNIKYKAYMPETVIKTTIDVKKVHTYFSAKTNVSWSFVDLNWEHEYEKILTEGGITSEVITDEQFSSEERKKFEESLLQKQRDFAFEMVKKQIFDVSDKQFTPVDTPQKPSGFFRLFMGLGNVGMNLKSGSQIRAVKFTDEIKYSAIQVLDSKISGNLTPLTAKSGAEAEAELKQYIVESRLDEDFTKIQIVASLNGGLIKLDKDNEILNDSPVSVVSIEIGYPDSKGNMVWKGQGKMIAPEGTPYVKNISRSGKELDGIFPATWNDKSKEKNAFVIDFVKNSKPSKVKVRQEIMYEKDKRVKLKDTVKEYEFEGTKIFVPLPIQNMINYTLSTEELFECDTLEVTLKVDKMATKKFKFTADNFEDAIPYRAWYELDYTVKPTEYKVKYTCSGKIGKKSKKVSISTDFQKIDYQEGDVLFELPTGTDTQNADIEKIRAPFME